MSVQDEHQVTARARNFVNPSAPYRIRVCRFLVLFIALHVAANAASTPSDGIVYVGGDINEATTWSGDNVYVLTGHLNVNSSLTIEPGAVVKSNAHLFAVYGQLTANGVVFTSSHDDEHGGDTNGDGPSDGWPGAWLGLRFDGSDAGSEMNGCLVRYAGGYQANVGNFGIHVINDALVTLTDTVVEYTSEDGCGYFFTAPSVQFSGCIARDNLNMGFGMIADLVDDYLENGNVSEDNSSKAVGVWGSTLTETATWTSAAVYRLLGELSVTGSLSLEPGTVIKSDHRAVVVSGQLVANEAVFTSSADDEWGGDSDGNGPSTGWPGAWLGLRFDGSDAGSEMNGCLVRYAGGYWANVGRFGISVLNAGTIALSRVNVSSSGGDGLTTSSPEVGLEYCTLDGAPGYYAVNNQADAEIKAEYCYWGHPSGPTHTSNPAGSGGLVSDHVDFTPWLTTAELPPTVLSGLVTDVDTGLPVSGATVLVRPQSSSSVTSTDENGLYSMSVCAGWGYDIVITHPGYERLEQGDLVFEASTAHEMNFQLEPVLYSEYRIIPYAVLSNPQVLQIPENGIGYMWFVAEGLREGSWVSVPQATILVEDESGDAYEESESGVLNYSMLPEPFHMSDSGLFCIKVPGTLVGTGLAGGSEWLSITEVCGVPLVPPLMFSAQIVLPESELQWEYRIYGEAGISAGFLHLVKAGAFAGGGSGAVLKVKVTEGVGGGSWQEFSVIRKQDLYRGALTTIGPDPLLVSEYIGLPVGPAISAEGRQSCPAGEEYVFNIDEMPGLQALAAFYLFLEPWADFGPEVPQISTNFFTWMGQCLIENEGVNGVEVAKQADFAGLDVSGGIHVGLSLGVGSPSAFFLGLKKNVGSEGHLGGTLKTYVDSRRVHNLYAYSETSENIGFKTLKMEELVGRQQEQAAGLVLPMNMIPDFEWPPTLRTGYDLTTYWDGDGWEKTRISLSTGADSYLLDTITCPGQITDYSITLEIDDPALYYQLLEETELLRDLAEIGAEDVDMSISNAPGNETFRQDYLRFLDTVYEAEAAGLPVALDYTTEVTGSDEAPLDFTLSFPLLDTRLIQINLDFGFGISGSENRTFTANRGKLIDGKPLLQEEQVVFEESALGLESIVGELWSRITTGETLSALLGVIGPRLWHYPFHFIKSDRGDFEISPNGSQISLSPGVIPAGVDSVWCHFWEWGDIPQGEVNSLSPTEQKSLNYAKAVRETRESIVGMRYGLGGFHSLEPMGTELLEPVHLTLRYRDAELDGIDESTLSVYGQDDLGQWQVVPSVAAPDSNWVEADIGVFRTYTLAPAMPGGQYNLIPDLENFPADGTTLVHLISETLLNNDGTPITEGTLFSASSSHGQITNDDADENIPGIQVPVVGGVIEITYRLGEISGPGLVLAQSSDGFAVCQASLMLTDAGLPSAPVITNLSPRMLGFEVQWESGGEADVSGYLLWYDTDEPGPPYDGRSSVWGQDSPVAVGALDSLVVGELTPGTTYYVSITALDMEGNQSAYSTEFSVAVSAVDDQVLPEAVRLEQNYPNPFNPITKIQYGLPRAGRVTLKIYDVRGRLVKTLVDGVLPAGRHEDLWLGDDSQGRPVASGVYLYLLETERETRSRKMAVVR